MNLEPIDVLRYLLAIWRKVTCIFVRCFWKALSQITFQLRHVSRKLKRGRGGLLAAGCMGASDRITSPMDMSRQSGMQVKVVCGSLLLSQNHFSASLHTFRSLLPYRWSVVMTSHLQASPTILHIYIYCMY